MIARKYLSRFDRNVQVILLWWEGAGCKLCERTGRAVGFIKVNKDITVFMSICVMITT